MALVQSVQPPVNAFVPVQSATPVFSVQSVHPPNVSSKEELTNLADDIAYGVDTNNVMSDLNDSYSSSLNEPEVIPEMNRARYQRNKTNYQTEPLSSQNARVTSEIHNRHRRYHLFTQAH